MSKRSGRAEAPVGSRRWRWGQHGGKDEHSRSIESTYSPSTKSKSMAQVRRKAPPQERSQSGPPSEGRAAEKEPEYKLWHNLMFTLGRESKERKKAEEGREEKEKRKENVSWLRRRITSEQSVVGWFVDEDDSTQEGPASPDTEETQSCRDRPEFDFHMDAALRARLSAKTEAGAKRRRNLWTTSRKCEDWDFTEGDKIRFFLAYLGMSLFVGGLAIVLFFDLRRLELQGRQVAALTDSASSYCVPPGLGCQIRRERAQLEKEAKENRSAPDPRKVIREKYWKRVWGPWNNCTAVCDPAKRDQREARGYIFRENYDPFKNCTPYTQYLPCTQLCPRPLLYRYDPPCTLHNLSSPADPDRRTWLIPDDAANNGTPVTVDAKAGHRLANWRARQHPLRCPRCSAAVTDSGQARFQFFLHRASQRLLSFVRVDVHSECRDERNTVVPCERPCELELDAVHEVDWDWRGGRLTGPLWEDREELSPPVGPPMAQVNGSIRRELSPGQGCLLRGNFSARLKPARLFVNGSELFSEASALFGSCLGSLTGDELSCIGVYPLPYEECPSPPASHPQHW